MFIIEWYVATSVGFRKNIDCVSFRYVIGKYNEIVFTYSNLQLRKR